MIILYRPRTFVSFLPSLIAAGLLASCASLVSEERKADYAEGAYLAEHLNCVDKAKTLEESKACRAMVRVEWRKGQPEAGKAQPLVPDDGGR